MMKFRRTRLLSLALILILAIGMFAGCGKTEEPAAEPETNTAEVPTELMVSLNVGTLKGPTGMGMIGFFDREDELFYVNLYDAPDQIMAALISQELDVAAVPSNVAAALYKKTEGGVKLVGVNTGGVLYLVSNNVDPIADLADLKGKTVYAAGQGGVPEYAFTALMQNAGLEEGDVDVQWVASHADAVSEIAAKGGYALIPEPQVTACKSKAENASVDINLNECWKEAYGFDLAMGVIVARKEVAEQRTADVEYFISQYQASLEGIAADKDAACEKIAEVGIVPAAPIAKAAMSRCNIMLVTDKEAVKGIIEELYGTLLELNPASIGGAMPADDFYFANTADLEALGLNYTTVLNDLMK
ncbi:MAG: ABC transporter substrate-binding protein [Clostridia bacterium]|nr:ABC transporter substrate-binding protein [Clostridia bacterium]